MAIKRFKKIYIEITNVCNLACNFCPKTTRTPKFMDGNEFFHIATQAKALTDHIYFHIMGEPLLNPQIAQFLEIANELDLKVNMTTNGVLLESIQSILLDAPALRQLNISLSSFEANSDGMNFTSYVDPIVAFVLEAHRSSSLICSLRLWNLDSQNIKGENLLNDGIIDRLDLAFGLKGELRDSIRGKSGFKLAKNVYLNLAEKFEWPDISKSAATESVFCYGLRDHIGILVDGTVVPCCLDSEGNIPLGNIFAQPLQEIINTPRAIAIYDGFSNRCAVEELCKKCGYAKRY